MKIIKNYLKTKQQQERLGGLAILAIEAEEAEQMNIKELIRQFADLKSRKKRYSDCIKQLVWVSRAFGQRFVCECSPRTFHAR
ncbi:zinc finger MYM-type protein 1-like [Aphis craccivora]|uniref:Zinc finger MYM-type protein 1-like n=1 Tax=Aphis craccivora TaxID=307492 RepID=A0A6G0Z522_APHCR|nr:zinc finger MYM-type protein 1-like [Aphis craccivora]